MEQSTGSELAQPTLARSPHGPTPVGTSISLEAPWSVCSQGYILPSLLNKRRKMQLGLHKDTPPSEGTVDMGLPMVPSLPTWVGSLTPSLMLSQAHHGLSRLGLTQPNTAKAGQKYEAPSQALLAAAAPEFELCSHFPPRESPKKASSLQPLPAWHHAACPRPQHGTPSSLHTSYRLPLPAGRPPLRTRHLPDSEGPLPTTHYHTGLPDSNTSGGLRH